MIIKAKEKGQALILIALAAIGLFAFGALAIDGSRAYSDKRHAQNAADTAALAGALAYSRASDINTVAQARATSMATIIMAQAMLLQLPLPMCPSADFVQLTHRAKILR